MNRLTRLISLIFVTSLLVVFQNCSRVNFTNLSTSLSTALSLPSGQTVDGNGTGYGGKLSGTFYRFNPDFACEGKAAPVASITASGTGIQIMENKQVLCGALNYSVPENFIDRSVFQTDVVGYQEGIFESEKSVPDSIPANLVEVWCKDTNDRSGYETITHYDRSKPEGVTRIYYTDLTGAPVMIKDFTSDRVASQTRVSVTSGSIFDLVVLRDQPSSLPGIFNGHVKMTIDNKVIERDTFCRVGGSLDPKIWPAKQIVDSSIDYFKIAPNWKTFGFSSSDGTTERQIFTGPIDGGRQTHIIQPANTQTAFAFDFTADSLKLVYELSVDKVQRLLQVFKANVDGSSISQVSNSIAYWQLDREYKMSSDGSTVVYRDGGDTRILSTYQLNLKSVSTSGGLPITLNPPLPGDLTGVIEFALSKSGNKVAFYFGQSEKSDLYFSSIDRTDYIKISLNYSTDRKWYTGLSPHIDIPDPGNFVIVRSVAGDGSMMNQTKAISIDGTTQIDFPENYLFVTADPSGNKVLARNAFQISDYIIVNLMTGESFSLPHLTTYAFNSDGSQLIGTEPTSDGSVQNILINTTTGNKTILCPEAKGEFSRILSLESDRYAFTSWSSADSLLTVFVKDANTIQCRKISAIKTDRLYEIKMPIVSKDLSFILVQAANHLYFIRLNGKTALQIDSPSISNGQIAEFALSPDSRSVVYVGRQLNLFEVGAFLWKVPQ